MSRFDDQPTLDYSGKSPGPSQQPASAQFPYPINSRYQCHSLLGHGSSGAVYRAYDHQLQREVAIKFIHRSNLTERQRLLDEARILAQLDHPNICRVYEVAEEGAAVYLVMSLIKGQPLNQWLGQFTQEQIVKFVTQICSGLAEAHRNGIIHCDVKPSNIVLEQTETSVSAVLVDFGVAYNSGSASASSTGAGTQHYMAPERSDSDHSLEATSDVYAVGATLRVLLTGHHDSSALRDIPLDLRLIINRCLANSPELRYPNAGPLYNDLNAWLTKRPISLRTSPVYRLTRLWQRSPWLRGTTVAASALIIIVALSASLYQANMQDRQLQQVQLHEQATRIESQIDAIYRSPPHNATESLAQVRDQVSVWLVPPPGQPAWLSAAQLSAAGRVLLQLNDNENAEVALTKAWALGERSANTAMALAILHQRIFTHELANARNLAQTDLREAAIKAAHTQYRLPALNYLDAVSRTNLPANYILAMRSYLEGNEEAALRILRSAQFPDWFYPRYELGLVIASDRLNLTLLGRTEGDIPRLIENTQFFAQQLITRTPSYAYAYTRMLFTYSNLHVYRPDSAPAHVENWLMLSEELLAILQEIAPKDPQYNQHFSLWLYQMGQAKNEISYIQRSVRHIELALKYAQERNYNARQIAGIRLAALTRLNFLTTFLDNEGISSERVLHRYFAIADLIESQYRGASFYAQLSNAYQRQAGNSSGAQVHTYWQLAEDAIFNAVEIAPQIATITANAGILLMRRAPFLPPGENLIALQRGIELLSEAHGTIPGNIAIAYNYASVILKRLNWKYEAEDAELAITAFDVIRTAKARVPNHQLYRNVTADILINFGPEVAPELSRQEQLEEAYRLVDATVPDGLSLIRLLKVQYIRWQEQFNEAAHQELMATLQTVLDGEHKRAYLNASMTSLLLLAFNAQQPERYPEQNEQLLEIFQTLARKINVPEPQFIMRDLLQSAAVGVSSPTDLQAVNNACNAYHTHTANHEPAIAFGEQNWRDLERVAYSIEVLFDVPCRLETDTESGPALSALH